MLSIPKKYIHDKIILVLMSINVFFATISSVIILLRLSGGRESAGYFVQYRFSHDVIGFSTGTVFDVLGFLLYAFVVLAFVFLLSVRAYSMRRELAYVILSMGAFMLILNTIISNGLLKLH